MPHPATYRCTTCRRELGTVRRVGTVALLALAETVRSLSVEQGQFGVVCCDCAAVRPWTGGVVYATTAWAL